MLKISSAGFQKLVIAHQEPVSSYREIVITIILFFIVKIVVSIIGNNRELF